MMRKRALVSKRWSGKLNTQGSQKELISRRTKLWCTKPQDYTLHCWKVTGTFMKAFRLPQRQLEPAKLFEQVISRSELNFRRATERTLQEMAGKRRN